MRRLWERAREPPPSNAIPARRRLEVILDLNDAPGGEAATGHGFLDHMLEQLIRHGKFRLDIKGKGDLEVDVHHLAEDTGIVLGQAFNEALGERRGVERYADAWVPMDETLAHVVVDLSGRPYLAFEPAGFEGSSQRLHRPSPPRVFTRLLQPRGRDDARARPLGRRDPSRERGRDEGFRARAPHRPPASPRTRSPLQKECCK